MPGFMDSIGILVGSQTPQHNQNSNPGNAGSKLWFDIRF